MILLGITLYYVFEKKKTYTQRERVLHEDSEDILDKAHQKEKLMIEEAIDKSTEVLKQTDFFTDRMKDKVNHDLHGAIEKFSHELDKKLDQLSVEYDKTFESLRSEYTQAVKETIERIHTLGDGELAQIQEALNSKSLTMQDYLQKKVDQEFANAQQEVENFKQYRLKQIETSLDELVLQIAQRVLGESISMRDHEQLVIDSLEKAKKEGLLNI